MASVRPGTVDYSRWDHLDSDEEPELRCPFRPVPLGVAPGTAPGAGSEAPVAAPAAPYWGGVDDPPSVAALKLVLHNDAALASLGEKGIAQFKTLPPPEDVQTREDMKPLFSGLKALVASLNGPRGVAMLAATSKALRGDTPAGFATASQAAAQRLRFLKAALWLVDPRGGFNAWETYSPELTQFVAAAVTWPTAPASLSATMQVSFEALMSEETPSVSSNPFLGMIQGISSMMGPDELRDARAEVEKFICATQPGEEEFNGAIYGGPRKLEAHDQLSNAILCACAAARIGPLDLSSF